MQKRIKSIPKQAMETLVNASWPGNVRELENFIERCVILTQGDELKVPRVELKSADPKQSSTRSAVPADLTSRTAVPADSTFKDAERQVIIGALKAASGRIFGKNGAAERLGLKRNTAEQNGPAEDHSGRLLELNLWFRVPFQGQRRTLPSPDRTPSNYNSSN